MVICKPSLNIFPLKCPFKDAYNILYFAVCIFQMFQLRVHVVVMSPQTVLVGTTFAWMVILATCDVTSEFKQVTVPCTNI